MECTDSGILYESSVTPEMLCVAEYVWAALRGQPRSGVATRDAGQYIYENLPKGVRRAYLTTGSKDHLFISIVAISWDGATVVCSEKYSTS